MSVYKRNRSWYYAFSIRGRRYRKAIPEARTKFQAQQAEVRAKEAVFDDRYGREPSNITLREFVGTRYLPWARENKRSWRNDVSRVKPILAYFRNRMMREIARMNVEQYRNYRRNTSNRRGCLRAPASVDREIQLLSRIFSLAIEAGEVQSNPCSGVKLLASGNFVTRYLSPEDGEKLKSVLTRRRRHVLDVLLISQMTGMRKNEILTLRSSQVDFVRRSIDITRTKSGRSRSVPIHPDLRPILQRLCEQAGPSGYLFENPRTGRPLVDIKTAWRSALRDAGIQHITFHSAGRHTFGTRAVDGGAPLSAVKDVMGHVDVNTTMRYVHATDEGKRRAVEAAARGRAEGGSAPNLPQAARTSGGPLA